VASPSLFEGAISALHKALNIGALQNKVLTSNIANIDTPNYKAFEVVMEDELKKNGSPTTTINLVCTQPQHLGNTVDLEKTMGKLAENTILYRAAAQMIKKKFQGLLNSIQGGMR
jgi:flagellar basal-body rod protein FlgB